MKYSGLNMENVKEHNRALIIQLICTNNGVTRQELTKASELTTMTLTNITSELIRENMVCEIESKSTERTIGRIPKFLYPAPKSHIAAGICISKDAMYGVITDLSLNVLTLKKIAFAPSETKETITQKLISMSDHLVRFSDRPLLGLGVSTVGVVDTINGRITYVMDFFDIESMEIQSVLQPRLNIPVYVKNDMQSAALCEMYFGCGKTKDHFIYVGLTNGVGSATVANKQLLNNLTGSCGELGHMGINYDNGEMCKCGSRGCLELYASVPRILQRINAACNTNLTDFETAVAFCEQSQTAMDILEEVSNHMAYALNNLINIVDISTLIFGHSGVFLPDRILDAIAKRLNQTSLFRHNRTITISKTHFDDKSPIYGAACNVLDQLFTGNLIPDFSACNN